MVTLANGWRVGKPVKLGSAVNSGNRVGAVCDSADGLTAIFSSERPGGSGMSDLWKCSRAAKGAPWTDPVNLGPAINSPAHENHPCLSNDGLVFMFSSTPGGQPASIFTSTRPARGKPWGKPSRLSPPVDSPENDTAPCLSADGLALIFSSDREGGRGGPDLYQATRRDAAEAFGKPVNLGPNVNTPGREQGASLSSDALTLVFRSPQTLGSPQGDLEPILLLN